MRRTLVLMLLAGCTTFGDEDRGDPGWRHPGTGRTWTEWPVETAERATDALPWCESLVYGDWRWRLPTSDELRTLFDEAGDAIHPGAAGFDLGSATFEKRSPINQDWVVHYYWDHEKKQISGGWGGGFKVVGMLCIGE